MANEVKKEKRKIESLDWAMIGLIVIGTIIIFYGFFKGLFMQPWTGM